MLVRLTRIREDVPLPAYATPGAVGFDIASDVDLTIPPHGHALVATGLIVAPPAGYALILTARSSLLRKKGLMLGNGVGTIDQDFCGPKDELQLLVLNVTDEETRVARGERLAQGLFLAIERAQWEEVPRDSLQNSRGGFGTSGGYAANSPSLNA